MPAGGVWWVNADREEDAINLVNHTLAAQHKKTRAALITMGHDPNKIINLEAGHGPDKIHLFTMPNHENGLSFFTRDLLSAIEPQHYFLVLLCANNVWQNISVDNLRSWLEKIDAWAKYHECTLLIVNPGNNNDKQYSFLMGKRRQRPPAAYC